MKYVCDICGQSFDFEDECRRHEGMCKEKVWKDIKAEFNVKKQERMCRNCKYVSDRDTLERYGSVNCKVTKEIEEKNKKIKELKEKSGSADVRFCWNDVCPKFRRRETENEKKV